MHDLRELVFNEGLIEASVDNAVERSRAFLSLVGWVGFRLH